MLATKEMKPAKYIPDHLCVFWSPVLGKDGVRERSKKRSGRSEAKKLIRLVREAKNARLILYSLRPYLAPFKTDCTKKGLFCKLLQVTRTYFCADLRMEENKEILNKNRGPSSRRVE